MQGRTVYPCHLVGQKGGGKSTAKERGKIEIPFMTVTRAGAKRKCGDD